MSTMKLRVPVNFPALVTGGNGISVTKENGFWTIKNDLSQIAPLASIPDPTQKRLWVYDPVLETYNIAPLSVVSDAFDGVEGVITNKTFDTAGAGNVLKINGNTVDSVTGTGSTVVLSNAPVISGGTVAADPGTALGIASKQYVDNVAAGLDIKPSVRAATTANITLSGAQTIDGVSVIAGDRVLVKNQSTSSQNGIYVAAVSSWSRAADMDSWAEVPGSLVLAEEGTANADSGWVCTANTGGTLGSTAITWSQFFGTGLFQANNARLTDIAGISFAQGDIIYYNGSNLVKLAAGTNGQLLKTQGAGANPVWTTASGTGDMLAANNLSDVASAISSLANLGGSPRTREVNDQTGTTYTFVLTDAGKLCRFSNAAAVTVTVPPNSSVAFAVGTQIDVSQAGAGKVTFAQGSGVTINSFGSNKALAGQYAGGTLVKTATDTWTLFGNLIA